MDSGAQRYLVKPDDLQRLRVEIDALILGFAKEKAQAVGSTSTRSLERLSTDEPTRKTTVHSIAAKGFLAP
jgi:DNA-binding response OmpR family regulator